MTPIISAKAKSLRVAPPKMKSAAIGRSVIVEVVIDRRIVSQSETLVITAKGWARMRGMFSRMRSKTMVVS